MSYVVKVTVDQHEGPDAEQTQQSLVNLDFTAETLQEAVDRAISALSEVDGAPQ